jgi:hypothetical protein
METYDFIVKHWVEISAIITGIMALASAIVKLTPTLKDDSIVLPIIKFISKYIALNRTTNDEMKRISEIGTINEKGTK